MRPRPSLARRVSSFLLAGAVWSVCAVAAEPTTRPAPGPAFTEHDLIRDVLALQQSLVVDAYEASGRRDPKWDVDAKTFLRAQLRGAIDDRVDGFYKLDDAMPLAARSALATKLLAAECDDPIVLYLAAQVLAADGQAKASRAAVHRAFKALGEPGTSKYSPLYQWIITSDAAAVVRLPEGGISGDAKGARERLPALLAAVAGDERLFPDHRIAVWEIALAYLEPSDVEVSGRNAAAIAAMPAGAADPWFAGLVAARSAYERSIYPDRTGGRDAGAAAQARPLLQAAMRVDDRSPLPPQWMMTLEQVSPEFEGDAHVAALAAWFGAATARQFDRLETYDHYLGSRRPERGGSRAAQLQIAEAALSTGRFDTRVPAMSLNVTRRLLDAESARRDADRRGRAAAAVQEGAAAALTDEEWEAVYDLAVQCYDGYAAHSDRPRLRYWAASQRVATAFALGRWDEARAALDAVSTMTVEEAAARQPSSVERVAATQPGRVRPDPSVFRERASDADDAVAEIRAKSGPLGAQVRNVLDLPTAEDRARRAADIAGRMAADDPGRPWLERQALAATFAAKLDAAKPGEWISVPVPAGDGLAPWRVGGGAWRADAPDAIRGQADAKGNLYLNAALQVPPRGELRCKVTLVDDPTTRPSGPPQPEPKTAAERAATRRAARQAEQHRESFGLRVIPFAANRGAAAVWIDIGKGKASFETASVPIRFDVNDVDLSGVTSVDLWLRWNEKRLQWLDATGKMIDDTTIEQPQRSWLGFGQFGQRRGIVWRVSEMSVRKTR